MRVVDVWQAIPFTILAIAVAVILGPSLRNVILVLGVTSWVNYARVVRGETLAQRNGEIVVAARVHRARRIRASCCATCCPRSRPASSSCRRCWWPA